MAAQLLVGIVGGWAGDALRGVMVVVRPGLSRSQRRHGGSSIVDQAERVAQAHEPLEIAAPVVGVRRLVAVDDHHGRRGCGGSGVRERRCHGHGRHGGGRLQVMVVVVGGEQEIVVVRRELEWRKLVDLVLSGVEEPVDDLAGLAEAGRSWRS
uniref:Uncharacterized protein n=1 Tax=Triticum urartu TaxID=4572 RepID=A0A8R7TNM3_TRIUA